MPSTIAAPSTEAELEEVLSRPSDGLVQDLAAVPGDLVILGAGGKMGPSLARLARRASNAGGDTSRRIIAVSRFTERGLREAIHDAGVETHTADLLDPAAVATLPDAPNVIFMAGRKFGSTGAASLTWAMNVYVPALVAQRYRDSRIVSFSSGNVYPLLPVASGGATEETAPTPVGEYAQSVMGRERMFEHFSQENDTPVLLLRLNYAIDLRYGVLVDVAQQIMAGQPVDLAMGFANVIWQGDANAVALRALTLAASPPRVLNLTGPETLSIRWAATRLAQHLGVAPVFQGIEAETALLSNASRCFGHFGYPAVSLDTMIAWVAHWIKTGGPTLNKPTHFQEREGKF